MENKSIVFDKLRLIDNIAFFIQEQGLKVGEVEEAIGVSQGYLSKLSKPSSKQVPSLETVIRLAHLFGITLNELIYTEFPVLTKSDRQVQDFLSTLIAQTANEQIIWQEVSYNEAVYNNKNAKELSGEEQIFDLEKGQEIHITDFSDGTQFKKQPLRTDIFSGNLIYLLGDCYRLALNPLNLIYVLEGTYISEATDEFERLFIMILQHESAYNSYETYGDPDEKPYTQLMIAEPSEGSDTSADNISVKALYATVKSHIGSYHLTPEATQVITAYLEQIRQENGSDSAQENSPENYFPINSDDLPF